jgi:hypothetical protein
MESWVRVPRPGVRQGWRGSSCLRVPTIRWLDLWSQVPRCIIGLNELDKTSGSGLQKLTAFFVSQEVNDGNAP